MSLFVKEFVFLLLVICNSRNCQFNSTMIVLLESNKKKLEEIGRKTVEQDHIKEENYMKDA